VESAGIHPASMICISDCATSASGSTENVVASADELRMRELLTQRSVSAKARQSRWHAAEYRLRREYNS
jgi:hypothetical protein